MNNDLELYHKKPHTRFDLMRRRALAMRILEENSKDGGITYEEIAQKMALQPWVLDRWPNYGEKNARDDLSYVFGMMEEDLKKLGKIYLVRQLTLIDDLINNLLDIANRNDVKDRTKISAISAIGPLLEKEIKITNNYPGKEVSINKRELTVNLDQFLAIKKKAESYDEDTVEGEIEE